MITCLDIETHVEGGEQRFEASSKKLLKNRTAYTFQKLDSRCRSIFEVLKRRSRADHVCLGIRLLRYSLLDIERPRS